MKRYTFETTYIVQAPNEAKARETQEMLESILRSDTQAVEHWTKLTDIEDAHLAGEEA